MISFWKFQACVVIVFGQLKKECARMYEVLLYAQSFCVLYVKKLQLIKPSSLTNDLNRTSFESTERSKVSQKECYRIFHFATAYEGTILEMFHFP